MDLAAEIERNVRTALAEDVGSGDLTALLSPEERTASASIISRAHTVLCGQAWLEACYRQLDPRVSARWHVAEGANAGPGTVVCSVAGPARALLTGERTALNFLQRAAAGN